MTLGEDYITAAMMGAEQLLLASATFCEATGLASQQAIRDQRIHWGIVEHDPWLTERQRPLAIINDTAEMGWTQQTESFGGHLTASGSVELYLAADTRYPERHTASHKAFASWYGRVCQEMAHLAGQGNYYPFRAIRAATPIFRTPRQSRANYDFFWVLVELPFAAGGGGT